MVTSIASRFTHGQFRVKPARLAVVAGTNMLKVIRHAIRANAHVIRDDGRAINETGFYRSKAGKVVAEIVVKQKEIDGITDGLQYVYRVAGSRINQIAEPGAIKMRLRITSTVLGSISTVINLPFPAALSFSSIHNPEYPIAVPHSTMREGCAFSTSVVRNSAFSGT